MKAIQVQAYGSPSMLKYIDLNDPIPRAHEVIVVPEAIGINFADLMMRLGTYPGGPQPPFIPGFEVCGTVSKVGKKVNNIQRGQRVLGLVTHGAYAEKVAVSHQNCLPLKDSLTSEEAVCIPVNFQAAYHMLVTLANIQPGQSVLIPSAAGGVGSASVQIAKAYGAKIIATVGNDSKIKYVTGIGADMVINYNNTNVEDAVEQFTKYHGVDIALECFGGKMFNRTFDTIATMGKMIVYGFSSGIEGQISSLDVLFRSRTIMGFHLMSILMNDKLVEKGLNAILELLNKNQIHPIVGQAFSLKDAFLAHKAMESHHTQGKIILTP